jgi:uncharacterized membrane protein
MYFDTLTGGFRMTDEQEVPMDASDVTSDDKLWSALGYPIPIIAIIVLFMEDKKARPFIKFHAVQSLAFNVILWAVALILSTVTLGIGALCVPVLWLVSLWPAYDSYQGNFTELPVITNFIKNQGWV